MTNTKTEADYMVALLSFCAELFCAEGISDTLFVLRFDALQKLQATLSHYSDRGYTQKLLCGIAERKAALILSANSKTETEKILKPHAPHYDGGQIRFRSLPASGRRADLLVGGFPASAAERGRLSPVHEAVPAGLP